MLQLCSIFNLIVNLRFSFLDEKIRESSFTLPDFSNHFNFYYCPGADTVPEVKEDDVLPVPDGPADEVVPEPGVVDVLPG